MHYYFMGICGSAMGNVALLLKEMGHRVSGADTGVYPPMSDVLGAGGISLMNGYDAERLKMLAPDAVVIGNVISRGNPELEWLLETRALPFFSMPELIGKELLASRRSVVITGTHGKTTTSTLTACVLEKLHRSPGWLIGGVPRDLPSGSHLGKRGTPFVIEGDEYDSAFFDKRSKFVHYKPDILVVNNIEFDHADIFRDLEDVYKAFSHVIRLVPRNGHILYNGDDAGCRTLLPAKWARCIRVGVGADNDLRITGFDETPDGVKFQLRWQGALWGDVRWNIPGLFNARNAAMALLAAGLSINPDDPLCAVTPSLLNDYKGVKRRQEMRLQTPECVVIEDFGHHPTALSETLSSLRKKWPSRTLVACFEPRSNTSRRNVFQKEFAESLSVADVVLMAPIEHPEKVAESQRLSTAEIARELTLKGKKAVATESIEHFNSVLWSVSQESQPKLIVFLSNGSFGGAIGHFLNSWDKAKA